MNTNVGGPTGSVCDDIVRQGWQIILWYWMTMREAMRAYRGYETLLLCLTGVGQCFVLECRCKFCQSDRGVGGVLQYEVSVGQYEKMRTSR